MIPGWMQIALVALLVILLFGRGKISDLMGDMAKGITSFRKGLKDEPDAAGSSPLTAATKDRDDQTVKSSGKDSLGKDSLGKDSLDD